MVKKVVGWIAGGFIGLFILIWFFTGWHSVSNGEVAVVEYKPYMIGSSGVDETPVFGPTLVYTWPSTSLNKMKSVPTTLTIQVNDMVTSNQVPLHFDIAVTIQLIDQKEAPALYKKMNADPVTAFRTLVLQSVLVGKAEVPTGEFMSYLRDQVRHYNSSVFISATNPDGTPSDGARNVEKSTIEHINGFLKSRGVGMIQIVNIALGRANPPPGVLKEIENTASQAQEAKTQAARLITALTRKDAETASAEADKAYLKALGLTTPEYIELKRIEAIREVCAKNNCTFINGQIPVTVPVK